MILSIAPFLPLQNTEANFRHYFARFLSYLSLLFFFVENGRIRLKSALHCCGQRLPRLCLVQGLGNSWSRWWYSMVSCSSHDLIFNLYSSDFCWQADLLGGLCFFYLPGKLCSNYSIDFHIRFSAHVFLLQDVFISWFPFYYEVKLMTLLALQWPSLKVFITSPPSWRRCLIFFFCSACVGHLLQLRSSFLEETRAVNW